MLELVTITGADDSTPISDLVALSKEFPFVEWGILISERSQGSYRFPSPQWISELVAEAKHLSTQSNPPSLRNVFNLSTHVCGRWVRQMMVGDLDWSSLPLVLEVSQRVQINFHAEAHVSTTGLIQSLGLAVEKFGWPQFIFQWDGVNDHLTYAVKAYGFNAAALFDTSGGAGLLPESWPKPQKNLPCGYAGGLGPDNVKGQLAIIEQLCANRDYWIDMERHVRTSDDSRLDLEKVRSVLETSKAHRARTVGKSIREEINRG